MSSPYLLKNADIHPIPCDKVSRGRGLNKIRGNPGQITVLLLADIDNGFATGDFAEPIDELHCRLTVGEDVRQFPRMELGIDWHHHSAGGSDAEQDF